VIPDSHPILLKHTDTVFRHTNIMNPQYNKSRVTRVIVATGLVVFAACGGIAWFLGDTPFGPVFNSLALAAAAGFVVAFAAAGIRLVRADSLWRRAVGGFFLIVGVVAAAGVLVLKFDSRMILCRGVPGSLSPAQWTEDLHHLAGVMEENHPDLFSLVDEDDFRARVSEIESRIPALGTRAIRAEFAGLVAMANDAHSFPNIYSFSLDWHIYPIHLYSFDDGVFVVGAGRELGHLVGCRLVGVGGEPFVTVYDTMRRYLSAENEWGWKDRFGRAVTVSEWLAAAGLALDRTHARFTFEDAGGNRFEETLEAYHYIPVMYWGAMVKVANDTPPPVPNDREDDYRFEYLGSSGTLYIQINKMQQKQGGETLAAFTERLQQWVDANTFERVVIDLRVNDGGSEGLVYGLAKLISTHEKINREGRLFGIISQRTFSAAVMFASLLANTSKITLVGEPTGQGPIFYGSPRTFELPNSKQQFLISSHLARADLGCTNRAAIEPDIRVTYNYRDFEAGRDPSMETILALSVPASDPPVRDAGGTASIEGRYLFSPYQALIVGLSDGRPRFEITDFVEGSYVAMRSGLYPAGDNRYRTDVAGVELVFSGDTVTFDCNGSAITAPRTPAGYRFALELIEGDDIEAGTQAMLADRELYLRAIPHLEALLNAKGYTLMREERYTEAVELFELNAQLYPQSSNVYDSLGEGLMKIGETESAILNYERSLELNPDNTNAVAMLERLRG
jgi:hypothetical protein